MESSKWIAAAASIWIQCSCGASYAFGIYSSVLKSSQGYDQSTLDTVSVFKDIGANAGVLAGVLYTAAAVPRRSRRFPGGPWVVHLAGAIQCFAGYFLMWLSVVGTIPRLPVPAMCCIILLATHGQTFLSTANVVTAVHNFPDYSGTSVGIMKVLLRLINQPFIAEFRFYFSFNSIQLAAY